MKKLLPDHDLRLDFIVVYLLAHFVAAWYWWAAWLAIAIFENVLNSRKAKTL